VFHYSGRSTMGVWRTCDWALMHILRRLYWIVKPGVLPHGKILPKAIRCLIVGSYRQRPEQVLQLVDMAQQGGRVEVQVELL
jgi:hypothetical protein